MDGVYYPVINGPRKGEWWQDLNGLGSYLVPKHPYLSSATIGRARVMPTEVVEYELRRASGDYQTKENLFHWSLKSAPYQANICTSTVVVAQDSAVATKSIQAARKKAWEGLFTKLSRIFVLGASYFLQVETLPDVFDKEQMLLEVGYIASMPRQIQERTDMGEKDG